MRQGSGGTYFINVRQVLEKLHIQQTRLLLKMDGLIDIEVMGHRCEACEYILSEDEKDLLFRLDTLEGSIQKDTKMALVYIAGYSTKDQLPIEDATFDYYNKYGQFQMQIDRGKLKIAEDHHVQWTFFCFIMFNAVCNKICRSSLRDIFFKIAEFYGLGATEKQCNILANIFLKNLCILTTPKSGKEPKMKILKLSEE